MPVAAEVLADCKTLDSGFTAAQGAVQAAQGSFTSALASDRAAIAAVCTPPVANRALCRRTRRVERAAIRALRREHRAAVRLYYATIEAEPAAPSGPRYALCTGGTTVPADAPIAPQQPS